jgi:phosphoribosylamine---glycine ligase
VKLLVCDMKDDEGCGVDIALRAQAAGHEVRYWISREHPVAEGMLEKVFEFEPSLKWADLTVLTGNCDYPRGIKGYFDKGYPIFGTNPKVAELELDRALGQEVFKRYGIETAPYETVESLDEAIRLVKKTGKAYAIKPWGGETDKAMTCVANDADEAVFMLSRWKAMGLKGQLMLQEKIDGIEMGIAGWFGPKGWSRWFEESFEHKKFLTGDLGSNTGEMGTVIRHVKASPLATLLLEPLGNYLHDMGYVGDCNVNTIIDKKGTPWPLEFTLRLGWPDFCIRQAVMYGDPVEWMADLLQGGDTLGVAGDVALGVVLTHGDFPVDKAPVEEWMGFPILGIDRNLDSFHLQQVMEGDYPTAEGPKTGLLSAGNYLMIVTGAGETVSEAAKAAYEAVGQIRIPSNLMYRIDIGERLKKELPELHKLGFARGLNYGS